MGLVADTEHNHLGLPSVVVIDVPAAQFPAPRVLDPSGTLRPGDTYFFTADQLVSRMVGVPVGTAGVVADFLAAIGRAAAAGAVSVIGLTPLAWDVPQRAGSVTTPAPTPTRVKRPRLPPGPPHVRVTFRGIFGSLTNIVEQWDFSVKTAMPAGALDGPALVSRATAAKAAYAGSIAQQMMKHVVLTETRYALTGADGKVLHFADGAFQQGIDHTSIEGAVQDGGHMPLQSALVVSLGTARPGATGRGRFYLPLQNPAMIDAGYRVQSNYATLVLASAVSLLHDINAIGSPVVINSSKGYNSVVTTLRVGLAPDTMRSRRESLAESYLASPVS